MLCLIFFADVDYVGIIHIKILIEVELKWPTEAETAIKVKAIKPSITVHNKLINKLFF